MQLFELSKLSFSRMGKQMMLCLMVADCHLQDTNFKHILEGNQRHSEAIHNAIIYYVQIVALKHTYCRRT